MKTWLSLFFCLLVHCSTGQIVYSTPQPLEGKGFKNDSNVVLSYPAFRLYLFQRERAMECETLLVKINGDRIRLLRNSDSLYFENNKLRANDQIHRDNVKTLKKNLFWTNLANGVGWGTAVVLAIKLLF
jgi:hypothetical protein